MDDKTNNISKKSIIIMIVVVVLLLVAGTFAWLSYRTQDTAMVLTVGQIDGLTVSLEPYQINASLSPVNVYTSGKSVNVTAKNDSTTEPDNFKLYYAVDSIDDELKNEGFKYTITKSTNNGSSYSVIKNGNFSSASNNSNIEIYQEIVPANTTYLYKVYIWIDSSSGNQSNMQNKSFVAELRANISETLLTVMKNQAVMDNISSTYVSNSNGVQFNAISTDTNGKGVYIRNGTENNPYPIYYYRGAVTNNNVLFANFCWKIVRTTDTGGVKLIYNGTPSSGKCTNTTGNNTGIGTSGFNTTVNSPTYVGYMYGTPYIYQTITVNETTDSYLYGSNVTYSNGKYTLIDTISGTYSSLYNGGLNSNHYSCFTANNICTSVNYIFFTKSASIHYITLSNGKKVEDALSDMFDYNITDSTVKTVLDTWYNNNLTSYTVDYIEDAIYCNDRSIYQLNGWNPNGGSTTTDLRFGTTGRFLAANPIVDCPRNADKFTVSNVNGNGKLTYPIGLLTADEAVMAGGVSSNNYVGKINNTSYYLYTSTSYRLLSPAHLGRNNSYLSFISNYVNGEGVGNQFHIRPVISLKPKMNFISGDGTANSPYVVE